MNLDTNQVKIIPFSTKLKKPIKTLNLEWLKKYFKVEPKDEKVLSDPQGEIIDKGGIIFLCTIQQSNCWHGFFIKN